MFGRKVYVKQCGHSDTQKWALISHPDNPEFQYRLNQRWLQVDPPAMPEIRYRKSVELAISFEALVNLTNFLTEKSRIIKELQTVPGSEKIKILIGHSDESKDDKRDTRNMDANSSRAEEITELGSDENHSLENRGGQG